MWHYVITDSFGALTEQQKQDNVDEFASYFSQTATIEAISGLLGNIEHESQLNAGQQEGGYGGSLDYGDGFIQWTPARILVNWCNARGLNWYDGEAQCYRIKCEGEGIDGASGYWLPTSAYPYSWEEFCNLTDVEECVKAYLYERERAGVEALSIRIEYANKWYEYLTGHPPVPPTPTRSKMPLYMMLRNRRKGR